MPGEKKRKIEEAAGKQTEKRRKVSGETSKTGGGKATGPELHGNSAPVAAAKSSKNTASAAEFSGVPRKDRVADPKSSASKAAGLELPGAIKGDIPDPSKSKAAGQELSSTPAKDRATGPQVGKSSASKAAGPELPGANKGVVTDTDKSKAAGLELCGTSKKRSATEAGLEEKPDAKKARHVPVGLLNFHRACFANAVTQCLQGTAPINSHFRRQAKGVLASVANCGVTEGDLRSMGGSTTRRRGGKKGLVRRAFRQSTDKVSMSAYFGELCEAMSTSTESSIPPFFFQQAFGNDFSSTQGRPMNGDTSEDSYEFLSLLLLELRQEELTSRKTKSDALTVVEKAFGVKTAAKVTCKACQYEKVSAIDDALCLEATIPRQREPLTLEECFSSFEDRNQPSGYKCDECGKADSTELSASIAKSQDHLILNLKRADSAGKNTTPVVLPQGPIGLSAWSMASDSLQDSKFEVYGVVRHHGSKHTDGHYDAMLKTEGQWWHLDDQKVSRVNDADFEKPQTACQIFLRKVSS